MSAETRNYTVKVWRQASAKAKGDMITYEMKNVSPSASFLEMFDQLNEKLLSDGQDPIAFDHDCREGICGMCSMYINGRPHGPDTGITTCQLHMRSFADGETIYVEPWRAQPFPVIKDLTVDRTSFDRIIQAGGYVSVNTGNAPDANELLIPKPIADDAMDAAACIGCGGCVATCKNGSAMLFLSAKVSQLAVLPQGKSESKQRAQNMLAQMDAEGFGACTNTGSCSVECPKEISLTHIARFNREYLNARMSLNDTEEFKPIQKPDYLDFGV